MPTSGHACLTEDLGHRYGDRVALRGIDLAVPHGAAFGVLGPNGGGKSTLLRILSTALVSREGRVEILGLDPAKDWIAVRRRIGVVFQSPAVDDRLTCRENLRHQGHLHGLRGARLEARIHRLLDEFGLGARDGDRVQELSGGLRRRLELAKALLHEPELLLLDEPSTGLDPGARADLWSALDELRHHRSVTAIVATHDMEEADRCDDLVLIHEGEDVGRGSPSELKATLAGDVLSISGPGTHESVLQTVRNLTGRSASILGNSVRVRIPGGHGWVARIVEACGPAVDSVSVSRPTLGDVFLERTGHGLENAP